MAEGVAQSCRNVYHTRRGSRGGGAGGARPPVFVPNSFKNPLIWPKYAQKLAPRATRAPPFSNPGSAPVTLPLC